MEDLIKWEIVENKVIRQDSTKEDTFKNSYQGGGVIARKEELEGMVKKEEL